MVDIWLPYGKTDVCARVEGRNLMNIVKGVYGKPRVQDVEGELERALKNPVGSKTLADVAKRGDKVALALNIPEPGIAKLVASAIKREISQFGLGSGDLTVVFANNPLIYGAHHIFNQLETEISPLGVNTAVHNPFRDNIYVGDAGSGIKVHLDRKIAEFKIKISASIFEPNPYTLYNCGEVSVALGFSSMETVRDILAPALKAESPGEEIFKNAVEASQIVNVDFSISVFRNLDGEAIRFFAGEPREVFHESLSFADSIYKVSVDGEAEIVLVSPGGSPFDANIVRACGCIENAVKIVGKNGVIILVAECSDGYGDPEFQRIIREGGGDLNMLEKAVGDRFSVSGFIAYRFLKAFKKASVVMVSAAPEYYASEIPGLRIFRTVNEALNYALNKVGGGAKVSAILNGSLIIPVVRRG